MSNTYSIIINEAEVDRFIEFLPNLKDGEKFMVALFARNKFGKTPGLTADKAQLKRFVANKLTLKRKLKQLEVKMGAYVTDKNVPINQESLVVYITPNPRDMHKAGLKTIKELVNFVVEDRTIFNPEAIALNMIQTCSGTKLYHDIDVDIKPDMNFELEDLIQWLDGKINVEGVGGIIKTRGGFHILVKTDTVSPEFKSKWYKNFINGKNEFIDITMNGDNFIPFPGCVQSDFSPILIR